jgi:hypothetical protein
MRAARIHAGLVALLALAGCRGCGAGALEVAGPTPYVRCLAAAPPEGVHVVGSLRLAFDERTLRITGTPEEVRIVAFSGPGFASAPDATVLQRLAGARADLALLLGGLGDDAAIARATVKALATLAMPTLLLAGGRDTRERIEGALAVQSATSRKVIDATALDAVRLGRDVLVPIAGASDGRYALDARSCGHRLDDLKERASALGPLPAGERRWLVAWEAPGEGGPLSIARTHTGIDTGSADLAELARRIGAGGGVFAWPEVQVARPSAGDGARSVPFGLGARDLRVVVPRLTGPAQERSDGTRILPGFAVLRLDADGLAVEAIEAF